MVRKLKAKSPHSILILMGCMAQVRYEELRDMKEVDLVLDAAKKFHLVGYLLGLQNKRLGTHACDIHTLQDFHAAYASLHRTRAFLKIQDGCNYNCTYCIIPQARGRSRSAEPAEVLAQAQKIEAQGVKEIVLTGVNIGEFAQEKGSRLLLPLLLDLEKKTSIPRFRISSIEPNLLSEEMIGFIATHPRFMPHFHLPLQSGSDKILRLMQRRYNVGMYEKKVLWIKKHLPHACIGADVMVGFPEETDQDFQDTLQFLRRLPISYIHVFTYSERRNTPAVHLKNPVPISQRKARNAQLRALSSEKSLAFKSSFIGTKRTVLFEQVTKEYIEGYTDNYIRIHANYTQGMENKIIEWEVA